MKRWVASVLVSALVLLWASAPARAQVGSEFNSEDWLLADALDGNFSLESCSMSGGPEACSWGAGMDWYGGPGGQPWLIEAFTEAYGLDDKAPGQRRSKTWENRAWLLSYYPDGSAPGAPPQSARVGIGAQGGAIPRLFYDGPDGKGLELYRCNWSDKSGWGPEYCNDYYIDDESGHWEYMGGLFGGAGREPAGPGDGMDLTCCMEMVYLNIVDTPGGPTPMATPVPATPLPDGPTPVPGELLWPTCNGSLEVIAWFDHEYPSLLIAGAADRAGTMIYDSRVTNWAYSGHGGLDIYSFATAGRGPTYMVTEVRSPIAGEVVLVDGGGGCEFQDGQVAIGILEAQTGHIWGFSGLGGANVEEGAAVQPGDLIGFGNSTNNFGEMENWHIRGGFHMAIFDPRTGGAIEGEDILGRPDGQRLHGWPYDPLGWDVGASGTPTPIANATDPWYRASGQESWKRLWTEGINIFECPVPCGAVTELDEDQASVRCSGGSNCRWARSAKAGLHGDHLYATAPNGPPSLEVLYDPGLPPGNYTVTWCSHPLAYGETDGPLGKLWPMTVQRYFLPDTGIDGWADYPDGGPCVTLGTSYFPTGPRALFTNEIQSARGCTSHTQMARFDVVKFYPVLCEGTATPTPLPTKTAGPTSTPWATEPPPETRTPTPTPTGTSCPAVGCMTATPPGRGRFTPTPGIGIPGGPG